MKIIDTPEIYDWGVLEKAFETAEGYHGVCILGGVGHRCGYVGLPKDHALYGASYDSLWMINIHGGLTYAGDGIIEDETSYHYVGFDCAHAGDAKDIKALKEYGLNMEYSAVSTGTHIWTLDEVVEEIKKLSTQLTPEALMRVKMEGEE